MLNAATNKYVHWGVLKEKAEHLLTQSEQQLVNHSLSEYQQGHVTVAGLVTALLQLCNTKAKVQINYEKVKFSFKPSVF